MVVPQMLGRIPPYASILITSALIAGGLKAQTTLNPGANLQNAINGASPGATLLLNPGTYTRSATLVISQPLTIQNAQSGAVNIQISGVVGIDITASNVTLAGLNISGTGWGVFVGNGSSPISSVVLESLSISSPPPSSNPGYGIYVGRVQNAIIDRCTITNAQVGGIYIDSGSTGAVVINNSISTVVQADGIVVSQSDSALVAGNTITGAAVDGIISPADILSEDGWCCP
jgi:parallel beta-helix repeat protein